MYVDGVVLVDVTGVAVWGTLCWIQGRSLSAVSPLYLAQINKILLTRCNCSIINPGPLTAVYCNVQGLVSPGHLGLADPPLDATKVIECQDYIYSHKIDVVILNETWFKRKINSSALFPKDYKVFRLDRSLKTHPFDPDNPLRFRKNGGGVLIAVRDELNISSYKFCKVSVCAELLTVIITNTTGNKFSLSTFYRVGTLGDDNFDQFKEHFDSLFKSNSSSKHILVGDFNLAHSDALSHRFTDYLEGDLGHSQLIHCPTHTHGRTLDLLYTNDPNLVSSLNILGRNDFCFSDHFAVRFSIGVKANAIDRPPRTVRLFDKGDYESMATDLSIIDWTEVFGDDMDANWNSFCAIIEKLTDKYIPTRIVKASSCHLWSGTDCDRARKRKEALRDKAKTSGLSADWDKYKAARKEFKKTVNKNLCSSLDLDKTDAVTKKFWKQVKLTSKSTRIPPVVNDGSVFRTDRMEQANLFNAHFASNFSAPSSYDTVTISFDSDDLDNFNFCASDVYGVLSKLNTTKPAGPDGIHSMIYSKCAGALAYPLSLLYNTAYSIGSLPVIWRTANVVPVHKKGDRKDVRNYRPISLTCIAMKVLERLVNYQLLDKCYSKLDTRQHGFLPGKSCLTQLIPFLDDLTHSNHNSDAVDIIYYDFSKAFDSVNHDILLEKLKYMFNIDGKMLNLLRSYLLGRKQRVVINGSQSDPIDVLSGVPQGSILGPLLFIMFINDVFLTTRGNTKMALFADDIKTWSVITCVTDCMNLQFTIDNLYRWSCVNKMNFHPDKCRVISMSPKTSYLSWGQLPLFEPSYNLNSITLDIVDYQRDLGVFVSSSLSWSFHFEYVLQQFVDRFNLLRRTYYYLRNINQKRTLYLTMVRSMLVHCCHIWAPQAIGLINKLEAAQKRCVKWIFNTSYLVKWSSNYYHSQLANIGLVPVDVFFKINDMKLFYRIIHGLVYLELPSYLYIARPSDYNRLTRSKYDVINYTDVTYIICSIERPSSILENSFFYRSHILWNSIPYHIRQCNSYPKFSRLIRTFLFDPIPM